MSATGAKERPLTKVAISPDMFRRVLGNYPTGVSVITARGDGDAVCGLVVGSFTSVSLDPPLVGFFPDKRSQAWPRIEAAGRFAVNVLSSDQQTIARQIAKPGSDKFTDIEIDLSPSGLPILSAAMMVIECTIRDVIETGDHWMVLGEVEHLEARRAADPMLFLRGAFGGFSERTLATEAV